ncbi:MAG TPA: 16S rRNA (cytosine(1402)-N(4))-methyltransferase [Lentisphaeria bacterium]|nr:MAG: 16S rRNA (cytosine(1402)-N(4))-methyltransferase [Lentisphaerae bacterium GWF2_49_21]HBC86071.1 16S rRNA (cytosine(1402)-N(4))-methyltransferase [Lentisphaeria bacterium]
MTDDSIVKKRRVRYRGTHPRRFEEKYKELNPQLYSSEVDKVMERGQTPAGMHRPVLVKEVLESLDPKPGMVGLDATLGFGGHAQELLKLILPGGRLIGIDVDPLELPRTEARLRGLGFSEDVLVVKRMNFAGLPQILPEAGGAFDFVLADLGVSSMQLDNPSRGFSFKREAPLDLRLNPDKGQPASELLKSITEEELSGILISNADESHALAIAKAIKKSRRPVETTSQVTDIVSQALWHLPKQTRHEQAKKSLQRTFQALRIAVNDEFGVLEQFLRLLPGCLKEGGRAAILTFHSGEDNRVKRSFLEGYRSGTYSQIAREPVRSSAEERRANPRSTCAKLRWAVKR